MKFLILSVAVILFFSCKKDEEVAFPKSYTFKHRDQSDEALYLVESSFSFSHIPFNTGTFGTEKDFIKTSINDLMQTAFDLKEIELLSEDSVRINFFIDAEEFDTTITYSTVDGNIVIDSLEGGLLAYDKLTDQFVVCSVTTIALPGPNVPDPGIEYYVLYVDGCSPGYSKDLYINDLMGSFTYEPLDTIGIILTRLYYQ